MQEDAGIVIRDASKLRKGRKKILELKKAFYSKNYTLKSFKNYRDVVSTWEAKSAMLVSEAVIKSALMRQESRGAHYRSDFPDREDRRWKVNIYCRKKGKKMVLVRRRTKRIKESVKDLLQVQMKVEHHLLE
jgi:succinate dehydrogenase / fumarate reductase flavoprotein subunit